MWRKSSSRCLGSNLWWLPRSAVGALLAVLAPAAMLLVDWGPKPRLGGSLESLGLSCALLLLPALCRRGVTSDFFVNELHAECYLPPLSKKGTKALYAAVHHLPIDPQAIESLLQTVLTAALDGYFDDRFFASICISGEFVPVF